MIDNLMWIVTAASLIGTVFNIHKRRACFYIWSVTNALWCGYDIYKQAIPQATLMGVYFGLAIYGITKWRGKDEV